MQPAAPGHQHQNPVEREVQTLIKGVSCLLCDQQSLGASWWDYAVESWIRTANCKPHRNEWMNLPSSATEIITRQVPDLTRDFKFPFGCPVSAIPPTDRPWKYAPSAEFGIALGASPNNNGSTLVYIPGKGLKPRERYDVSLLKVPAITSPSQSAMMGVNLPATSDSPVMFPSGFISPNSTAPANAELTQGTLGMDAF